MTQHTQEPDKTETRPPSAFELSWLRDFPPGAFAIGLSLAGFAISWRHAAALLNNPLAEGVSITTLGLATIALISVCLCYGFKTFLYTDCVIDDVRDPNTSNFFSASTMTLMLLAMGLFPTWATGAEILWVTAAITHLLLTLRQIRYWIIRNFEVRATSPTWFIPISGSLLAPTLGLQLGYSDLSWMLFSMGLGFWISLFVLVLNRIMFHDQLPAKYVPTLFLLMAPHSLAFLSYIALTGTLDAFAKFLFHFAFMMSLLVFSMVKLFTRLPFSIAWWAYIFPLDAITQAAFVYARMSGSNTGQGLAWALLLLTSILVILILIRTLYALMKKELLPPRS